MKRSLYAEKNNNHSRIRQRDNKARCHIMLQIALSIESLCPRTHHHNHTYNPPTSSRAWPYIFLPVSLFALFTTRLCRFSNYHHVYFLPPAGSGFHRFRHHSLLHHFPTNDKSARFHHRRRKALELDSVRNPQAFHQREQRRSSTLHSCSTFHN